MELQSVNFFYKSKMVASKMAALNLKWLSQFRLNLVSVYVRFYGSINPIESVKLPSVNYLDESKMATSKMAVSKMTSLCCIASKHRFVPVVAFDHHVGRQQR